MFEIVWGLSHPPEVEHIQLIELATVEPPISS